MMKSWICAALCSGFNFLLRDFAAGKAQIFTDGCVEEISILRDETDLRPHLILIQRLERFSAESDFPDFVIPEAEQ